MDYFNYLTMKIMNILRSKVILVMIQFIFLSLMIYGFNHSYQITFDSITTLEQQIIIQFLANYIIFNNINGMIFLGIIWLITSLIPIIIHIDFKKAYATNFSTFFLLNFFFYVFCFRYSPDFISSRFPALITHTLILGIIIITYSIGLSLIFKYLKNRWSQKEEDQFIPNNEKSLMICPKCGTEFQSIPMFCYNCNTKISNGEDIIPE